MFHMKHISQFISQQVDIVIEGCKEFDIEIPAQAADNLSSYISELNNWNSNINLLSQKNMGVIGERHILDSISPLKFFVPKKNCKLLDIGSGAGFPAIPLKIFRRDIEMTLVEARKKKVFFLQAIEQLLDFDDFEAKWTRIEQFEPEPIYDIVISRATASPEKVAEYAKPHIKPGGKLVFFLGPSEINREKYLKKYLTEKGFTMIFTRVSPFYDKFYIMFAMRAK